MPEEIVSPAQPTLGSEIVAGLFAAGTHTTYAKGEIIIHNDNVGNTIFYIENGFVKVYSVNNRGEMYVHLIYGSGELFPLSWMVDQSRNNLYFEALSDTSLYALSHETFQTAIGTSLKTCNAVLRQVIAQFAIYIDRLDNLHYKYVQERVIYRLLLLAQRFGRFGSDGSCRIDAPISQQLIASSINASRENVSRELERLRRKGLITYVDKRITIINVASLQSQLPGQLSFSN